MMEIELVPSDETALTQRIPKSDLRQRLRAFSIHLAFSAIAAACTVFVVFGLWYPSPLHTALGVTSIFLMVLAVDVTIGPLLTLVVYNKNKKTLVLDLAVIALLQIAALGYGVWTVFQGRPAWLVFNVDRFDLVSVVDIDTQNLKGAPAEYQSPPWTGPRWVAAAPPSDTAARNELTWQAIMGGADFPQRPDLYQPLERQLETVQAQLHDLKELESYNSADSIKAVLAEHPDADAWLPLKARIQPMTVLMKKKTGRVIAIVDLRPWQ